MKKTFKGILILIIIIIFMIPVKGEGTNVKLSKLDLSFTAPEGWTVLTRDVSEDESYLEIMELSKSDLVSFFDDNNIYADILSEDGTKEFVITMFTNNSIKLIYNMSNLTDNSLKDAMAGMLGKKESDSATVNYTGNTYLKKNGITYIVSDMSVTDNDSKNQGIQYYTVYNGMAVSVSYYNYSSGFTDEEKAVVSDFIGSFNVKIKKRSPLVTFVQTYSWAFFISAAVAIVIALFLILYKKKKQSINAL